MISPDGVGHLLRGLREAAGYTRAEQAALLERIGDRFVDPDNIKRWETEKRLPIPDWHELIACGYGISVDEVRKAVAASRRHRRLASMATLLEDDQEVLPVERREFLGVSALAAGAVIEPWGRLTAAVTGPRVGSEMTSQLVDTTADMFVRGRHLPAQLLAERLAGHLETLTALIPRAGAHRTALLVAAGETAALAGWAAYDTGNVKTALHYYKAAALAGREAGHPPVMALTMGYASYATDAGKAREMLAAAQSHVRGPGYATARTWLAGREAEEAAAVGDREGALRSLDRANTAYDYADPDAEQAWVRFCRRPRLDSLMVSTYARLCHPDLERAAQDSLDHLGDDTSMTAVAVLSDAATGYVVSGEVDQGVEVGRRFVEAATANPTTIGRKRLAALSDLLPLQHSAARDLSEHIRASLAA
ncbi:helix-turn-helix domain-containing protein [Streptomyces sp. NPDC047000]|uniref:helix-turn-helix domain-containing protein n=1 Tax=Streptomyces sp. NPDC047000 TaxID=3155474 RepID=UPI0033C2D794